MVSVIRTQRFAWDQVSGFMGERRHDEARLMMVLDDQRLIPLPGTLDPEELDPYGDEGQMLSAADQLNQLREVAIAGDLPEPAPTGHAPVPPMPPSAATTVTARRISASERKELRAALKAVPSAPKAGAASIVPRPRR